MTNKKRNICIIIVCFLARSLEELIGITRRLEEKARIMGLYISVEKTKYIEWIYKNFQTGIY